MPRATPTVAEIAEQYAGDVLDDILRCGGYSPSEAPAADRDRARELVDRHQELYTLGLTRGLRPAYVAREMWMLDVDG